MTQSKLLLLLLLAEDEVSQLQRDCVENEDDWSWLYDNDFIGYDDEKPFLIEKGEQAVAIAVKKADELV